MNATEKEMCVFLEVIHVEASFWILFSAIFTSVINTITMLSAVAGNGMILYILLNYERLHVPSNVFVGCLCLSDFMTGLIVQPLSVFRRLNEAYDQHFCHSRIVCAYFAVLCFGLSIMSIGLISIDRCLAITLPFRYRKFAHNSHFLKSVVGLWLVWGLVTLLPFTGLLRVSTFFKLIFATTAVTTIAILISYCLIVRILRNHRRKIGFMEVVNKPAIESKRKATRCSFLDNSGHDGDNVKAADTLLPAKPKRPLGGSTRKSGLETATTLQVPLIKVDDSSIISENSLWCGGASVTEKGAASTCQSKVPGSARRPRRPARRSMREFATKLVNHSLVLHSAQRNGANTIAIVIVFVVVCYLPQTILLLIRGLFGDSADVIYIADTWCDMLLFLNSSINPVIYCLRSKDIKDCICAILKRKRDTWQIESERF